MEAIHSLLPTDIVVIDNIDDEFYDAIHHLIKQDIIGLALEEPECDRYSDLEWLSVSTSMCTFIFDIKKLQNIAFIEGLKTVLENPRIVKILHDCRRPSDCLYHQYGTKLNNIYDTQVADFIANVQKVNPLMVSKTVHNLYHCLSSYLKISEDLFNPRPIKSDYTLRPIKLNVKEFIIKNVIYLRFLKKELDVVLRMPYRRCVDIYMQSILRKSDGEMKLCPPESVTVPPEILIEGMQVFQITDQLPEAGKFIRKRETTENYQYRNEESYGNIVDSNFSRDFDRTEVINFLMERMFNGNNGTYAHSDESDRYSVRSSGILSSFCDSVSPAKKTKNIEVSLSTLSKLNGLLTTPDRQNDSKLLPFENQCVSDTSSFKDRSEKSMTMSKTIGLVKQLKLKSGPQSIEENSKQCDKGSSLVELIRDSAIHKMQSEQLKLLNKSSKLKEVNNNLVKTSVKESIGGEDPISIITSKDISPSDMYKYVMSNRSKASSKKSISDSNDHITSKHSECSHISIACEDVSKEQTINKVSSEVMKLESVADYNESFSTVDESDNVQNVEHPWEKLRSAFDGLGPQRPTKKSLFIPAGMNY